MWTFHGYWRYGLSTCPGLAGRFRLQRRGSLRHAHLRPKPLVFRCLLNMKWVTTPFHEIHERVYGCYRKLQEELGIHPHVFAPRPI
jgi:hypothetical protein